MFDLLFLVDFFSNEKQFLEVLTILKYIVLGVLNTFFLIIITVKCSVHCIKQLVKDVFRGKVTVSVKPDKEVHHNQDSLFGIVEEIAHQNKYSHDLSLTWLNLSFGNTPRQIEEHLMTHNGLSACNVETQNIKDCDLWGSRSRHLQAVLLGKPKLLDFTHTVTLIVESQLNRGRMLVFVSY